MFLQLFLAIALVALVALVAFVKWRHSFWERRGIPFLSPAFPLGNFSQMMLRQRSLPYIVQDIYQEILRRGERCAGVFQLTQPMLMLADPELIREVTVKYFDHFVDRRPLASEKADEVFSRSLLVLRGQNWRDMRHTLSPAFTGSKMRIMVPLIARTGRQLVRYLSAVDKPEIIDVREAYRRFSADVIATTAYGFTVDSLKDPDNQFFKFANHVLDMKGHRGLVLAGYILSPKLMEILGIPLIPNDMKEYFVDIITNTMRHREENGVTRPDMIQLLIDARKIDPDNGLSDMDIVSQAVSFFLGGFESITTTVSFASLELAANPEVQERLRAEVDTAFRRGGGQITYQELQSMKYMDMVIAEVSRMYPAIPMADRVCTKHFELNGHNIEPGTVIGLPIYGLHHDPNFFPQPEKFDPERFSEDNKHEINPFAFLPFGTGPRGCIGMRFSQLEIKLCLAHVLAAVELDVCDKTPIPVRLSPKAPLLGPEGDFWLKVTPRTKPSLVMDID